MLDYFSLNDTLVFVSEFHKGKERIRTTQWQWAEDVKEYLEEYNHSPSHVLENQNLD